MVRTRKKFPSQGDFVIGKIADTRDQYVYVDLIDYDGLPSDPNARGMIHISEISSRWIKNIRNHVRVGQKVVLRVLRVDTYKGHVDLSLKRVNSAQKQNRMKEWKYAVKFENLLQFLTEEVDDLTLEEAYELIGFPLLELFNDNYQETIEELKENGETILARYDNVSDEIKEKFLKIIDENVEISTVSIIGRMKLSFTNGNGIVIIKNLLKEATQVVESPKDTRKIEIHYIGAPFYRLEVISKDYLDAENILSDALEIIEKGVEEHDALFEFVRE